MSDLVSSPDPVPDPAELLGLLRWYADMGVDLGIDEAPHDRFADAQHIKAASAPLARPSAPTEPLIQHNRAPGPKPSLITTSLMAPPSPPPPDQAALEARQLAQAAGDLTTLQEAMERFEGCGLKRTASQLVFADGNPKARVMLVGEAPGAEDDQTGLPFMGRAGQLLDRMLAAIQLDRSQVYIVNSVPWRPPGNRTPSLQEAAICLPFLHRQIELVGPELVICLGASAAQSLLDIKDGIMKSRGKWVSLSVGSSSLQAMATLHPSYLLRQPAHKKLVWRDMLELRKALDQI